ncbi:hypothetical protein SAMN05192533_110161 [Mesobacillus persicus]|uniref:Uncharacterized protein n=1 Tax=Mesobacillus persicus TaxID=930146 RepID=A0A1H8F108_9BACI|nr:hypothetical protein SAMN05192533_110161 [Mesobacillus persicus]
MNIGIEWWGLLVVSRLRIYLLFLAFSIGGPVNLSMHTSLGNIF